MIEFSKKPFKFVIGWALVGFGIAGLFLPIIQGVALIIVGLIMLESDHLIRFIKRLRAKWRR